MVIVGNAEFGTASSVLRRAATDGDETSSHAAPRRWHRMAGSRPSARRLQLWLVCRSEWRPSRRTCAGPAPPRRPWHGGVSARLECGSGPATGARTGPAQHHDRTGSPKPGPTSRRPRYTVRAPSSLSRTTRSDQTHGSRVLSTTELAEHRDRVGVPHRRVCLRSRQRPPRKVSPTPSPCSIAKAAKDGKGSA